MNAEIPKKQDRREKNGDRPLLFKKVKE